MLKRFTPERLARASSRRPWLTIGIWVLLVVAAGFASSQLLGGSLTHDANFTNKPESIRAQDLANARLHRSDHDTEFVLTYYVY